MPGTLSQVQDPWQDCPACSCPVSMQTGQCLLCTCCVSRDFQQRLHLTASSRESKGCGQQWPYRHFCNLQGCECSLLDLSQDADST